MLFYLGLVLAFAVQLALSALSILVVARWSKAERSTLPAATASAVVLITIGLLFFAPLVLLWPRLNGVSLLLGWAVTLPIQIALQWYALSKVHRATSRGALLMWLAQGGIAATFWLTAAAMALPFAVQAFVSPTNAMAPTVRGFHRHAICSACGGQAIVPSPIPSRRESIEADDWKHYNAVAICDDCLAATEPAAVEDQPRRRDRILVNKLRSARRWDVAVFYFPEQPELVYLSRVVGLPGETVEVKNGRVYIDGQRAPLPPELEGLIYEVPEGTEDDLEFAREGEPLQLGDEYFVLGDFSVRSHDSRFWGPVPSENMIGVLLARYWPLSRWQFWK